jgi:hypothetical protein
MSGLSLTTARASRLLGLALIIWGLSDAIVREAYLIIQHHQLGAALPANSPLAGSDSLFVFVPSLVAPAGGVLAGSMLLIFSRRIENWLR